MAVTPGEKSVSMASFPGDFVTQRDKLFHRLQQAGAFLSDGHYAYDNGMHGTTLFDASVLVVDPVFMADVAAYLVGHLAGKPHPHTVVATPHARELAQAIARRYHDFVTHPRVVYAAEADREAYGFPFRFACHVEGKRVLVVDAVVNGDARSKGVIAACRRLGAEVIGLVAVADRGGWTSWHFEVPHYVTLVGLKEPQYAPKDCPGCQARQSVDPHFGPNALHRIV